MWVPHIYMTCAVDLEDSNGLSRGREAHLATNCDPPVGTGRQSHPNAVNLQLRANRWWLQVETLRTWRQKDIDKDSTPWKSLKIANSPSFLINVLTCLNQLHLQLSTWGHNANLPNLTNHQCSAMFCLTCRNPTESIWHAIFDHGTCPLASGLKPPNAHWRHHCPATTSAVNQPASSPSAIRHPIHHCVGTCQPSENRCTFPRNPPGEREESQPGKRRMRTMWHKQWNRSRVFDTNLLWTKSRGWMERETRFGHSGGWEPERWFSLRTLKPAWVQSSFWTSESSCMRQIKTPSAIQNLQIISAIAICEALPQCGSTYWTCFSMSFILWSVRLDFMSSAAPSSVTNGISSIHWLW